mmetsp:Transcript_12074/g.18527  ORF Transcript_12074/g.18527 Transcript_12074/m.18527 type:complete len:161 (+) Transcript_12074:83-565(+)
MKPLTSTKNGRSEADIGNLLVGFRSKKSSFGVITNSLNGLKSLGSMSDAKRAVQGLMSGPEGGEKNANWDMQSSQNGASKSSNVFLSLMVKEEEEETPESNISACALRDEILPKSTSRRDSFLVVKESAAEDQSPSPETQLSGGLTANDLDELDQIEGSF